MSASDSPPLAVAGMVTLYNSEQKVVQRIGTYIEQVQKLYVVDNAEEIDSLLINSILTTYPTAYYISNNGNKGIANALNVAAKAAIDDHFDYLLLMDDDSEAPSDLVASLYKVINEDQSVGIVSAQSDSRVQRSDVQEVITTITSGSILSLKAYSVVGPFLDELFIDWVDHEYSFRLRRNNYRILAANQVKLKHRLGIFQEKRLLGFIPVRWRSHNPVRLYYKFRNSQYVMSIYAGELPKSFKVSIYYELLRDIIKIIWLEENKGKYTLLILKGLSDARSKKLGKLIV